MSIFLALPLAIVLLRQDLLNSPLFHFFFHFRACPSFISPDFFPFVLSFLPPDSFPLPISFPFPFPFAKCSLMLYSAIFNAPFPGLDPPLTQCPLPLQTERTVWTKNSQKSNFSHSSCCLCVWNSPSSQGPCGSPGISK